MRLFTTLVRFDAVYHPHFKCNRQHAHARCRRCGATRATSSRRRASARPSTSSRSSSTTTSCSATSTRPGVVPQRSGRGGLADRARAGGPRRRSDRTRPKGMLNHRRTMAGRARVRDHGPKAWGGTTRCGSTTAVGRGGSSPCWSSSSACSLRLASRAGRRAPVAGAPLVGQRGVEVVRDLRAVRVAPVEQHAVHAPRRAAARRRGRAGRCAGTAGVVEQVQPWKNIRIRPARRGTTTSAPPGPHRPGDHRTEEVRRRGRPPSTACVTCGTSCGSRSRRTTPPR